MSGRHDIDYSDHVWVVPKYVREWLGDLSESDVMDFGCGTGATALGMGSFCKSLIGVDIGREYEQVTAIASALDVKVPGNLSFASVEPDLVDVGVKVHCIYSWSVFEQVLL